MHRALASGQRGFNLIESLVALVVVSVGMIGIASLFGQGLGAGRSAMFRTQAVSLTADMADRIRVNRRAAAAYGGAAANNHCDAGGGAPAEMAAHELFSWSNEVAQQLPNGVGAVQYVGSSPPTYVIRVTWREVGLGTAERTLEIRVSNL